MICERGDRRGAPGTVPPGAPAGSSRLTFKPVTGRTRTIGVAHPPCWCKLRQHIAGVELCVHWCHHISCRVLNPVRSRARLRRVSRHQPPCPEQVRPSPSADCARVAASSRQVKLPGCVVADRPVDRRPSLPSWPEGFAVEAPSLPGPVGLPAPAAGLRWRRSTWRTDCISVPRFSVPRFRATWSRRHDCDDMTSMAPGEPGGIGFLGEWLQRSPATSTCSRRHRDWRREC